MNFSHFTCNKYLLLVLKNNYAKWIYIFVNGNWNTAQEIWLLETTVLCLDNLVVKICFFEGIRVCWTEKTVQVSHYFNRAFKTCKLIRTWGSLQESLMRAVLPCHEDFYCNIRLVFLTSNMEQLERRNRVQNLFKTLTAWVDLRSLHRGSRFATHQVMALHTTTVLHFHKQECTQIIITLSIFKYNIHFYFFRYIQLSLQDSYTH